MNKLLLTIITLLLVFNVFGQNGVNNGNLFILQNNDSTITINSYENNKINAINTFKVSNKSIFTTDQKERVAIVDTAQNSVNIIDIISSKQIKISIPFEIKPKAILLNSYNLFVGGEMGKEILLQYHLKNEKWYQLEIPKEVIFFRKAVDDLVINDSLLIAVDNIVMPKYILYYNLNSKDKLSFSHFKELKSNSSYESIHQARITFNYLGLLSTTMNHGNIREHITIYSDLDLLKSFAITVVHKRDMTIKDFLLVDDKLYIANSSKGLGILNIKKSYFKASEYEHDDFNFNIKERLVKYKNYKDEEIIKLTRIPNEQKIILTIKNTQDEIRTEIKDVK